MRVTAYDIRGHHFWHPFLPSGSHTKRCSLASILWYNIFDKRRPGMSQADSVPFVAS